MEAIDIPEYCAFYRAAHVPTIVSVRSDCPACVMEWVIVFTMDSGHLEVGDGGEEGVEEAGLV